MVSICHTGCPGAASPADFGRGLGEGIFPLTRRGRLFVSSRPEGLETICLFFQRDTIEFTFYPINTNVLSAFSKPVYVLSNFCTPFYFLLYQSVAWVSPLNFPTGVINFPTDTINQKAEFPDNCNKDFLFPDKYNKSRQPQ